jgi:hypothetical protein
MRPRLLARVQASLRSLSRLSFTDSLVLIFLILGALWILRFAITSAHGQVLDHNGRVQPAPFDDNGQLHRDSRAFNAARTAGLLRDPIRTIEYHQENIATAPGWCFFFGKVTAVMEDGINIHGFFGPVAGPFLQTEETTFFVTHLPIEVAEGDTIDMQSWLVAKDVGIHTYKTPLKGQRGLRHLDYGIIARPRQPSPAEVDSVLQNAIKGRHEMDALMAERARAAATNQAAAAVATNPPAVSTAPAK